MGANPFDRVPSTAPEGEEHRPTFQEIQAQVEGLVRDCESRRHQHRQSWEEHKREHHARRFEEALAREAADERFVPPMVQRDRDHKDDLRYSHLTDFDQLLELVTHEEYLRARRAWERRHRVEDVELNVQIQPSFQIQQLTGRQIWALLVALFVGGVFLLTVAQAGPAGLVLLPLAVVAWAAITRLPLIYLDSSSGGTRGASGSAV